MIRKVYLSLILFFISTSIFAQSRKVKDIEKLTQEWASANNNHDLDRLTGLYAPTVLFYGKSKDISSCIKDKELFFKVNDYAITISNIDIDFYRNGTIKCNFNKQETWKGVNRSDQAYLLFEQRGKKYFITGESDNRMDTKLGVDLRLGDKVYKKSNIFNIVIGALAVLFIGGIMYFFKRKGTKRPTPPDVLSTESFKQNISTTASHPVSLPVVNQTKSPGHAFEDYVASLFDAKSGRFKIKRWSSDMKASNGLVDESNKYPDIEFEFLPDKGESHKFAIECKWRSKFHYQGSNLGVKWAEAYQIKNYLEYEAKFKIPVWVVIGLGGTESKPDHIYLIRLTNLAYPFVFETVLKNYKRKDPTYKFFYNPETRMIVNI